MQNPTEEDRNKYLRLVMLRAKLKLKNIALDYTCNNPKYTVCKDPLSNDIIVSPYSSVVSVIGFETRKEAEMFLANPHYLKLVKEYYGILE